MIKFIIILLVMSALIGWGFNVYRFATLDFEKPYRAEIVRGVGIAVFPVGALAGYMTIGEEEK